MKGSVYSIRSHQTKDIYIGSTKETLSRRMAGHRRDYNQYINGDISRKCSSIQILQYEDAYIELIELIEYNDKSELTAREGYYIRNMDCVNKVIPNRTHKEWQIKYYIDNKEEIDNKCKEYRILKQKEIAIKDKEYYNNNKEKVNEKMTCECDSIIMKRAKNSHFKTKKHQDFIKELLV